MTDKISINSVSDLNTERLLAKARAEVERLQGIIDDVESESGHCLFLNDEEHKPPHLPDHVRAIVQERDAARAELRRMSEWHDEIADALRAEVERLRADLREALSLLRDNGDVRMFVFRADMAREVSRWARRCDALLAKHKETP